MINKIVGVIFIVAGIALIMWGYDVYDSASSQITRTISGDTPIEAWAGMIGGGICVAIGVMRIK